MKFILAGKPPNEFAFNAEPKDRAFALNIVKELNEQWKKMMAAGNVSDFPFFIPCHVIS